MLSRVRLLMEDNLWGKMNFNGRRPSMEDDLWWMTTFDLRWPLTEDDLWWKTTFYGRRTLMKEVPPYPQPAWRNIRTSPYSDQFVRIFNCFHVYEGVHLLGLVLSLCDPYEVIHHVDHQAVLVPEAITPLLTLLHLGLWPEYILKCLPVRPGLSEIVFLSDHCLFGYSY